MLDGVGEVNEERGLFASNSKSDTILQVREI
jgi:hypothetical protein